MEGKRAVSRCTQISMEAFVPWVQHRLNDLLGIPKKDERRKVLMDVKVGLEAWIKHELNGVLGLQQEDNPGPVLLNPWIEHHLIDHLWRQQKNEGEIVAAVESKFDDILSPMIDHQWRGLIVQIREIVMEDLSGQSKDEALKLVMDPMLISLIKHHLNDVLSGKERQGEDQKGILASLIKLYLKNVVLGEEQQGDEKGAVVFLIKQHLKDVLSGKQQQVDEKGMLVSLIKHQLSVILGEGRGKGVEEQKMAMAMAVSAPLKDTLYPLVKYQLGDQLKIERPKIMQDTRTRLEGILDIAKALLQELGDNDEKKKAVKQKAAPWEWVDEFISVSYQIVAVLEERKKIAVMNEVSSSVPSMVKKRDRSASKLKEINVKLESLLTSAKDYSHTYNASNDKFGSHVTNSRTDESEVYCRMDDIKSVLKHLLPGTEEEEEEKAVKVMSIVGRGGSGKTSLAKFVFDDHRVKEHFNTRVWVSVSNPFDCKRLALDILRNIGNDEVKEWKLESVLEKSFCGKVFLCVFDDVRDEDMQFAHLFRNGAPGSRILVTTRSEKAACVVGADWKQYLKPLSIKDWWLIWRNRLGLSDPNKFSKQMVRIGFKIVDKCNLESLLTSAKDCSHTCNDSNDEFGSLVTNSHIDESEVYCRKHDIKSVLKRLLPGTEEEEEKAVKVMSIVGCGGSGKTSLAKFVFNDPGVKQHFEPRVWVSVSNFFDDKRLARDILGSIGNGEVKEWELDSVLEKSFCGKVFLCVFDDVWTEDSSKWMRFAHLFRNGAPGSRILVTTRSEKVACVVGADWKKHLNPLSNNDWWLIWRNRLGLSDQNKVSKKMMRIGSKIAVKCNGLPLAAIALGQILLDKNTAEEWQGELKKVSDMGDEIWRIRDVALELFRHFHWSYRKLSPAVKLCILYCADFDKGTVIIVDQLIRMWMAQGYLGYSWEKEDKKTEKGLENFDDLASHSFFQELVKGSIHKDKITSCKLSDTFHDFIRYEARHDLAALQWEDYSAVLEKRREIHFHHAYCQVPQNFNCTRWKDVSTLVLSSSQLEEVPSEVGDLRHVQYLDLSNNLLKKLPETVCNLACLEYLDVHRCYMLLCLPQHIQKLEQLKHLRLDFTTDDLHKHLPEGFEKLRLIRTLDVFKTGGRMYKDAMEKLKGFTHLTDICISVHGEVKFSDADFDSKVHLENLELCFVEEGLDQEKASKIMEDLKPPPNLEMLKFDNYPLTELPKWILEQPLQLKTLKRLSFRSAMNIASFPALWKLPSLEFLWLYDIPKLKHIGREFVGLPDSTLHLKTSDFPIGEPDDEDEIDYIDDDEEIAIQDIENPEDDEPVVSFPKLKTLRIECMKNLEEWQDLTEDEKKESRILVMPSLEELIISRCPKLIIPGGTPPHILGDTPWYKRTNPPYPMKENAPPSSQQKEGCSPPEEKEETVIPIVERQVESNGLPDLPTMPFDKDSDVKLREFVHEAYIIKGSLHPFEVSIPKGVLGKTEITACLPLEDLYGWLQPDGWVFAEQLCIWSKLIYERMTKLDKKRVQMVSSALITTVDREEGHPDTRDEVLVKFMIENVARLYLVPFLRPAHWELLAIVPENGVVYRFDSLQGKITTELTDLLKNVERRYVLETPSRNNLHGTWRILDIKHKRQTGNWECGYYVMIWMHKIVTATQSLDLKQHFPFDESPYEPDELKRLAQKWCAYVLQKQINLKSWSVKSQS